jgi:hypothetical protein
MYKYILSCCILSCSVLVAFWGRESLSDRSENIFYHNRNTRTSSITPEVTVHTRCETVMDCGPSESRSLMPVTGLQRGNQGIVTGHGPADMVHGQGSRDVNSHPMLDAPSSGGIVDSCRGHWRHGMVGLHFPPVSRPHKMVQGPLSKVIQDCDDRGPGPQSHPMEPHSRQRGRQGQMSFRLGSMRNVHFGEPSHSSSLH